MLNNINSRGLSKSKNVEVLRCPGATSSDTVDKIDDVLDDIPKFVIVHLGTDEITSYVPHKQHQENCH